MQKYDRFSMYTSLWDRWRVFVTSDERHRQYFVTKCVTFSNIMTNEQKDTLTVRVTSVGFAILVFALFKPLGMGDLGWMLYLHLAAIWVLGMGVCYVTEAILKYLVRMPASFDKGVEYIIRRNLWFQLINTPLISLVCCVYLHFPLATLHSPLTWTGYLTMLLIIAFCSFTIGLYWRFKFRSKYLAAELEQVRLLNEELRIKYPEGEPNTLAKKENVVRNEEFDGNEKLRAANEVITLCGSTSESLTLSVADVLYIESVGNYVKVYHLCDGEVRSDMLRATSKQMEETLKGCPMIVRCHRAFLVNLGQVEKITSQSGNMQLILRYTHDTLPVSRTNTSQVKSAFNSL